MKNNKSQDIQNSEQMAGQDACQVGKKTTIGGQALIEGLMMIGPDKKAMAIRKADGTIAVEQLPPNRFKGSANVMFVRGSVRLFRQLVTGTKALLRSAEMVEDELESDDESSGGEKSSEPKKPFILARPFIRLSDFLMDRFADQMLYLSAVIGILFSVALFILLPNFITGFIRQFTVLGTLTGAGSIILLNLIEGLIRITIFIGYLAMTRQIKDIRRVWMYHGAEHKTIACYEAHEDLTVENVRQYSRFHPRCGTAFMFIVILVSIIVFSFAGWWGRWINLLVRFALVPLVAGIAYEIIRLAGRYDNVLTRIISAPGLWLQRLTTAEPDDSMLEVSIAAMNAVIPDESNSDRW